MKKALVIATLLCLSLAVANAGNAVMLRDSIEYGQVGNIRLGESLSIIKKMLGRNIVLDCLGSNRGGALLSSSKDLRKLHVARINGHPVSEVELMFVEAQGVDRLAFVAFIIDCSSLDDIKRHFPASFGVDHQKAWQYKSNNGKYLVGGSYDEVCNFWIRKHE